MLAQHMIVASVVMNTFPPIGVLHIHLHNYDDDAFIIRSARRLLPYDSTT